MIGRLAAAALPVAVAAVVMVPAGPLAAAPSAAADPPRLELTSISPLVPDPEDRLTLSGRLVQPGPGELSDVRLQLRAGGEPVSSRSELAAVAAGDPDTETSTRAVRGGAARLDLVSADRPGQWQIAVPVADLALSGNGVYVLRVLARTAQSDPAAEPVAELTTFLPFLPDRDLYDRTRLSWIWPLVGTPGRDAHGAFGDDTLASALAPGGRLSELAAGAKGRPVTWVVDPELLEAAQDLAGPHQTSNGRRTRRAPPDPNAARWLAELTTQLADRPVAATPYADPDVAALAHQDDRRSLTDAITRARTVTGAILGRESDTSLAWPAAGAADAETLGLLSRAGVRTVVLSSAALRTPTPETYTPTGRARLEARDTENGPQMEVLVADAGLAGALSGDLSAPGAAALAAQRFLADTALITLERPNDARTVLVAPPRRWSPPAGWAAALLAAAESVPWLRLVGLSALSQIPAAPEYAQASTAYPEAAADAELGSGQIAAIGDGAAAAADVTRVLTRPGELAAGYTGALLRAASSRWRDARRAGREYVEGVVEAIRSDRDRVQVIGRNLITLSDSRGTIPVTVSNDLDQAVTVRPVLRPRVGSRLSVTNPEPLTIEAGRKETVRVPAEAAANGITQVDVVLLDAEGRRFGPVTALRVNVRNFGMVGMVVLITAGGTLFGAAVVRNVRRFRRRPNGAAAPATNPDGAELSGPE